MPRPLTDIIGNRYVRLSVIAQAGKDRRGVTMWLCQCDCGEQVVCYGQNLIKGKTKSCGCLQVESRRGRSTNHRHGHYGTAEWRAWSSMKTRCTNPNSENYQWYGGRGITVCQRWMDSFEHFLADMGPKPSPDLSLDRIDPDGNYEPGNCRWADSTTQRSNQRRAHR